MLNVVCLMGRLSADPELRHTQSGTVVTSFRIAVDRTFQPKGQEKQTDWIDIVAWRNTAEFISNYFRKGSMIALQGSIQTRQYTDKDGNKRTAFEVIAENVFFAESKKPNDNTVLNEFLANARASGVTVNSSPAFSSNGNGDFEEIVGDDELPF